MNIEDIVLVDKDVLSGTPVFHGTRVPVKALLDYLEQGEDIDVFLNHFPTVKREQVLEFLEISAKEYLLKHYHENIAG